MNIPLILQSIRPGADWSLNGEEYSGLQWIGPGDKPTLQNLETAWAEIQNSAPPAPEATPLQVRLFLRRRGIDPETIPALIASVTAEGEAREEALERWKSTQSFPKAHPLVIAVAALLSLNLDEVWNEILAIEYPPPFTSHPIPHPTHLIYVRPSHQHWKCRRSLRHR